jgi:hypothetical protein
VYSSTWRQALACSIKVHKDGVKLHKGGPCEAMPGAGTRELRRPIGGTQCCGSQVPLSPYPSWSCLEETWKGIVMAGQASAHAGMKCNTRFRWIVEDIRCGGHGMLNLLSSSKKRRPSRSSWLGKAWSRFIKLLTRINNIMKISK